MRTLADIREEYEFLDDRDDRTSLLNELGKALEPMPAALKTEQSLVRGCQAKVWAYPQLRDDGTLHFFADSESGLTKGMIALVLAIVQDKPASVIASSDVEAELKPFHIERQLTSVRTSGLRSMIALIRETAARYA